MNFSYAIDRFILCELQAYLRSAIAHEDQSKWISFSDFSAKRNCSIDAVTRFFKGCAEWKLLEIKEAKIKLLTRFEFNQQEECFFSWMREPQGLPFDNNKSLESYLLEIDEAIIRFNLSETSSASRFLLVFLREIFSRFLDSEFLSFVLVNNKSPFDQIFSLSNNLAFEQYEKAKILMQIFSARFAIQWYSSDQIILKMLDLENLDILDLGGGSGGVAFALSEQGINVNSYTLLDLPSTNKVLVETRELFYNKLNSKKEIVFGDFLSDDFDNPKFMREKTLFYDVVILSWIIHDWPDEKCIKIVFDAKRLLKPSGRLIIIERIMDSTRYKMMNFGDFMMLVTVNGLERNLSEYDRLLALNQMKRISHLNIGNSRDFLVYVKEQ